MFVFSLFLAVNDASADDFTGYTTTTNVAPTVTSIVANTDGGGSHDGDSTITLNEGVTSTLVYVQGVVTELNGCSTLATSDGTAMFAATTTLASTLNIGEQPGMETYCNTTVGKDACYMNTGTSIAFTGCTGGADTTASFSTTFSVRYYALPTSVTGTWHGFLDIGDDEGLNATGTSASITIPAAAALDLNSVASVAFGELALGGTSANQTLTIRNTGNTAIDYRIFGGNFSCTAGSFAASSYVTASTTNGSWLAGDVIGLDVNDSAGLRDVTVSRNTNATDLTARTTTAHLKLKLPTEGVSGSCSGTVSVTAVSS